MEVGSTTQSTVSWGEPPSAQGLCLSTSQWCPWGIKDPHPSLERVSLLPNSKPGQPEAWNRGHPSRMDSSDPVLQL